MIAPCIRDGKCFDESDEINIELTQNRCLRAARPVVPILPVSYLFHAAPMMRGGFVW
jgi:hypothetical protein